MVVQRCPAVPAAAKVMPRTAKSRSADGATIAALLPPSSSRDAAKRAARRGAISRPIRSDPVADTRATRGSSSRASQSRRSASSRRCTPSGAPTSAMARSSSAAQAREVNGVASEGFQITVSPQTSATAVFHDHTAAGKLNAEMTATTPRGCQDSDRRWPGRSDGSVRPAMLRDSPTA